MAAWPANWPSDALLRQYFPKGDDLRGFSVADLKAVEHRLNGRPRKHLNWRTPNAAMQGERAG